MKKQALYTLAALLITGNALAETVQSPRIINPDTLYNPAPYGYSHIVVSGNSAFIAGQGGENKQGQLAKDFEDQVKQAYHNLSHALKALDATPNQVVKINTYVVNYDQSKLEIMSKYLNETFRGWLPAQTLIPVPRLAIDGMLFEVDATVMLNSAH